MEKWLNVEFESSSSKTLQFIAFAKDFKSYIKELTKKNFDLVGWSVGHFIISGFLQDKGTGKFVYFSLPDVRFDRNGWAEKVLVRTAKDAKDFSGGSNWFCKLEDVGEKAKSLV